jgi:predicted TPR repeat methyltransferase
LHTVGFTTIDGIDVSQRSLAIAKTTEAYRCLTAMDTQRPPLSVPDDHYDGLICLGVLTYLPETTNTLTEFSSVVKSGGFIATTQQSKI